MIIPIIIVIIILILYSENTVQLNYLVGIWTADKDLGDLSGINSAMMYIGPRTGYFARSHKGHLIMEPEISNQGFTLSYSFRYPTIDRHIIRATFTLENDQIIPEDILLDIDIMAGSCTIKSRESIPTIYLKLYKEHNMSDLAQYIDAKK